MYGIRKLELFSEPALMCEIGAVSTEIQSNKCRCVQCIQICQPMTGQLTMVNTAFIKLQFDTYCPKSKLLLKRLHFLFDLLYYMLILSKSNLYAVSLAVCRNRYDNVFSPLLFIFMKSNQRFLSKYSSQVLEI